MNIRYRLPLSIFPALALDLVARRRRGFKADADACLRGLEPPLRVLGEENVPAIGPCVVTVNHYHRFGFSAEWLNGQWIGYTAMFVFGALCIVLSMLLLGKINETKG